MAKKDENVVVNEEVKKDAPKKEATEEKVEAPKNEDVPATDPPEEEKNEVAVTEQANEGSEDEEESGGLDLSALGFSDEELALLTGLDAIDSSEIRIPYATLISKKSRDNDIGDIVFADGTVVKAVADGESVSDLSVLAIQPVRVYFPTPFNPNNSFICRSLDGRVGAPDGKFAGRVCDTCEFAQYPEGGGASPCRDQRLLLCADEDGGLFHLQVSGVGVKVWKKFMSSQVLKALRKAGGILGAVRMQLHVRMEDTSYGEFPVFDFKVDPKNPVFKTKEVKDKLEALKSYKEFQDVHAATAADQSRVQMAAGENEQEGTGNAENEEMF